jgi:hypothetical protein
MPRAGHKSIRYRNTKMDTGSVRSGFRWLRVGSRGENDKSVIKDGSLLRAGNFLVGLVRHCPSRKECLNFCGENTQSSIRGVLRAMIPWVKQAERESDLRLHLVSLLCMLQASLHSPHIFTVWYLIKHTENFIFVTFFTSH